MRQPGAYVKPTLRNGHVYKSSDAGRTWVDISANLPDLPTWKLAIDPRTNNLYIGTDNGVYFLPGGVGQWQRLGTGMPNVQVKDVFLDIAGNRWDLIGPVPESSDDRVLIRGE